MFNKDKLCGCKENVSGIKEYIESLEGKWKNGIYNYDYKIKICFISDNFNQFIEKKKEEKFIKETPFEVYNEIVHQLSGNKKTEWIQIYSRREGRHKEVIY